MALMLRMVGIPTRVVSGFAPGTLRRRPRRLHGPRHRRALLGRGLLPRHRLGHLRPDARPPRPPSRSRSTSSPRFAASIPRPSRSAVARGAARPKESGAPAQAAAVEDDGAAVGTDRARCARAGRARRRRLSRSEPGAVIGRSSSGTAAEAQLAELVDALRRLGWGLPPHATLLAVERRFRAPAAPRWRAMPPACACIASPPVGRPAPGPDRPARAAPGARRRGWARAAPARAARDSARGPAREGHRMNAADAASGALSGVLETCLYHAGRADERDRALLRRAARIAARLALAGRDGLSRRRGDAAALRPRGARRARRPDRGARDHRPGPRLPARRLARAVTRAGSGDSRRPESSSPTSRVGDRSGSRSTSRTRPATCSRSPTATCGRTDDSRPARRS